jgi:hypothetical protein
VSEVLHAYDIWRWRASVAEREEQEHPQNRIPHERMYV